MDLRLLQFLNASTMTNFTISLADLNAIYLSIKDLPEALPANIKIFLIVIYVILIVGSIVGNILVILVILLNKTMRTVTNVFLLSLAMSDTLISSWNMPLQLVYYIRNQWTEGVGLCKFTSYCQSVSVIASIFTLTAVAIERYYAICHPLRSRKHVHSARNAGFILLGIWIVALGISLPQVWIQGLEWRLAPTVSKDLALAYFCVQFYSSQTLNSVHTYLIYFLCYVLPTVLMCGAYGRIAHSLWVRQPIGTSSEPHALAQRNTKQKKRIVKMLMILVILFVVCWFPFFSVHVYLLYYPHQADKMGFRIFIALMQLLGYSNAFFNPFVYCFMNQNFRQHIHAMFKVCPTAPESKQTANSTHNSTVESKV